MVRWPPLWPDHENFLQATLYEKVRFLPFSSKFQKKWVNLRLPLSVHKQKVFQLQGGFAPLIPRPGALPLDPAGGSPSDPRYRLALRVLAMALPNPKYATVNTLPQAWMEIIYNGEKNLENLPSRLALSRFLSECFSSVRQKAHMYSNIFLLYSGIAERT